ncbi:hypothetical protein HHL22_02260 [Hymenobacter sp. RP-2-7]|uniref:Uncharacterized protein n=1 Tax=Hymenobacter polaris TaxID=2682546 RepID=A0A7Y0FL55_9BACT|nr:hypothetical protein [Hymenobacter polaris]NML64019.1 hypothetical protein [Hymenobacter polaris]
MVPIIVSIIVPLLLYLLNRSSKQKVTALDNGGYELRMNKAYLIIGIAGAVVGLLFLLMPILADEYSLEIFIASGVMFLLVMGFTVPCIMWYKNHSLFFGEQGFITENAYGKRQDMQCGDISQVSFSSFAGVVSVVDKQGNVAKAHQHLVGFSSFVKMLMAQRDKYHFDTKSLSLKTLGLNNY